MGRLVVITALLMRIIVTPSISIARDIVNPKDYGLQKAKTGVERYEVLMRCHMDALERGVSISYAGIDTVRLEIPKGAKSIPLTSNVDFAGSVLVVTDNYVKNFVLFELSQKPKNIVVSKSAIDRGDLRSVNELNHGMKLLVIEDKNLWVDNRVGYSYGAKRKDVLLLKDGMSFNQVIAPYNNAESEPVCLYCDVNDIQKVIRDLTILRDSNSEYMMFPFKIEYQNNVLMENITLVTPKNSLEADKAISINNSTNVVLRRINAVGSYSQDGKYGYVFSMNNLWNTTFDSVDADATWGVIGSNNLNQTRLNSCIINRFDIHCYGRDVQLTDCTIRKSEHSWYCGGSSIFGTIRYDNCTFYNTSPYANGDSYKTYVPEILLPFAPVHDSVLYP